MRIAEVSALFRPPSLSGEREEESFISMLTGALVERGHEVTLFATADTETSACLRSPVKSLGASTSPAGQWQLPEAYQASEAFKAWREFDVIHCHCGYFGLLYCDVVPIPSLHTARAAPEPEFSWLAKRTRNRHLHFFSRHQARDFTDMVNVHVLPLGVEMESYFVAPAKRRQEYVAFLGRFSPQEGALEAIEIARKAGLPIKLSGPLSDYYREAVAPNVDGQAVEYLGDLEGQQKAQFLACARALLYCAQEGDPFGLTLMEAMACGVPVVVWARGIVPELVEHGLTGWVSSSAQELADGLWVVDRLDRDVIRHVAELRFSRQKMLEGMERLLKMLAESGETGR